MLNSEALKEAENLLIKNKIDSARLEAEILLAHVLNTNRINLYLGLNKAPLTEEQVEDYRKLIQRRISHEPTAYIIGHKHFMNLDLIVNENVLIPRPETEILVESVIERIRDIEDKLRIVDIGTGSGAIGLTIAKYLPDVLVDMVDISDAALEVARRNAEQNGVIFQVNLYSGDMFAPVLDNKYNVIVSNPPYIPSKVIDTLQIEVQKYEPRLALDGGEDGLDFYRKLVNDSPQLLLEGGLLAFEIGIDQADDITKLIESSGQFINIEVIKDLADIDRVIIARKK